mgnify:CR=1 FL=1
MQKKNTTVHLLILDPSQNDAESLVSLLRNSGKATRAHRITSEEDLEETLKNGSWDLLLARDTEQEFGADDALAMIRRMDKDIPFILLTGAYDHDRTVAVMRAGAQDTVQFDFTDQLVLVVNRELAALGRLLDERQPRPPQRHELGRVVAGVRHQHALGNGDGVLPEGSDDGAHQRRLAVAA